MKIKISLHGIAVVILAGASAAVMADPVGSMAQPKSADVSTAIGDTAITTKVKAKYMDDPRLKDADISVTTANGIVTLTGSAPNTSAKSAAEELAKAVSGVGSVEDNIQTPSVTSQVEKTTKHAAKKTLRVASDSWITTKVKSSLLADSITKGFKISVKTIHHVVALSGTVDTQASADHAANLAKQIDGVASVNIDNLKTISN